MRKACLIFALFAIFTSSAYEINSYQKFTSSIRAGDHFTILFEHEKCTGYFVPSSMLIIPASDKQQERVVTSHLHFTDHFGFPAYEYIKYTFSADNNVLVHVKVYDPVHFKEIGPPYDVECSLGTNIKILLRDPIPNNCK